MSSRAEVDERLAKEEVQGIQEDEQPYVDAVKDAILPEQLKSFTDLDYLTIVRGYQTYDPRLEETIKAAKTIAEWRESVNYDGFLRKRLEQDKEFHSFWPEYIYGEDKYGHPIVYMRVSEIDTEKLSDMDSEHMLKLQGQKQTAYHKYKQDLSAKRGEQRYKYILIVDLKGTGMSILGGKRRHLLQKIFAVGADNFPESIWKIFVINTPFIFRTVWAIVKPWIHPITQAKVNIHGSVSDAVKRMEESGIEKSQIPEMMGGTCKPLSTFEYLLKVIEDSEKGTEVPADGSPSSSSQADNTTNTADEGSDDIQPIAEDFGHLAAV